MTAFLAAVQFPMWFEIYTEAAVWMLYRSISVGYLVLTHLFHVLDIRRKEESSTSFVVPTILFLPVDL